MKIVSELLSGTFLIEPPIFIDERGDFVKTFHAETFSSLGMAFTPRESFYSTSRCGVLRGMHFQTPPHAHAKLVYCIRGSALDVVVDLRKRSPRYGAAASAVLSERNHQQLFIPLGVAHGFLALEDDTILVYMTTTVHSPSHDLGIRWDSFGFDWGTEAPTVSARDASLPTLGAFDSPFLSTCVSL